ncbi:MAG: DNA polymerase III subunit gamma/tau [Saprospiraceae bacterium]
MEEFLVSARKYRPLKWSDVIGQDHVTQTLKNSLIKKQIAHAFLFCGPRGIGKTTCARILARVLNCENPTADYEPCNSCPTCKAFQENNSFNIFELDAASNNSVEDVRSLVEQVRYQPQYGKYKIYIIDEVHMLSTAAFNAFLKTLEEPPPYAKFILATTEKHKIIPTILSRCQVYDFRRISVKDIIEQLSRICKQENIETEPEVLFQIAQKSDGAMRDALSIFDRIKSFSGKQIKYQDVLENLNILDFDYYFKFFDAFLTEDIKSAFLLLDNILKLGFDTEVLLEGLAGHSRNLLVCKNRDMLDLFDGSENSKQKYIQQSENSSLSFIMSSLDLINESNVNLSRTKNRRLLVEVLLAKLCHLQSRKSEQNSELLLVQGQKKNLELESRVEPPNIQIELKKSNENVVSAKDEISQISKKVAVKVIQNRNFSSSIPQLASLESIKEKLNKQEKERVENLIELNEINFQNYWDKILLDQKSKTLQDYMRSSKFVLNNLEIVIQVGSILGLESIKTELRLEDEISKIFLGEKLTLRVEIDAELSNREEIIKPKKLYSAKEKWDLMITVNPLLEDLQKSLELKLNED